MRTSFALPAAAVAVAAFCVTGQAASPSHGANAALIDASGTTKANATLVDVKGGVRLTVDATGLPAGVHGIHVHTTGACTAPDFKDAGPHWNPMGKMHGTQNPQGPHLGDLPNITIKANGKGRLQTVLAGAHLADLMDADGSALVIHADADDYKTDPSGNSGGRIACGVIKGA